MQKLLKKDNKNPSNVKCQSLEVSNANLSNNKILIEEVLKSSAYQTTNKIFLSSCDGKRSGPFVLKEFRDTSSFGAIYKNLLGHNCKNIPTIYCVKDKLVLEQFVDGDLLTDLINAKKISLDNLFSYCKQLCNAVSFLHCNYNVPIIHRDIKPSNIIVSNGHLYLLDFNIARLYDQDHFKEPDTVKFGTVGFAPPEQFGYQQTDVRSDVYSLGKVISAMLSSINLRELNHKEKSKYNGLNCIAVKATCFDPDNRFKSVEDIRQCICSIEEGNNYLFSFNCDFSCLNINRFVYKIGILWNLILTICLCFFEILSVTEFFFNHDSFFSSASIPYKLLVALSIMGFVYLPIYYVLLFKPHIRYLKLRFPSLLGWFPILNWLQQIIMIIFCFIVLFILVALSNIFI